MRLILFLVLASAAAGYTLWIYQRVELAVRHGRRLAVLRMLTLVCILALLFDPRVPVGPALGSPDRWVLLDASLSMGDVWAEARERAAELESGGWTVVGFGDGVLGAGDLSEPAGVETRLSAALERASEAGVRRLVVLSDLRFHDAVQVRATLALVPVDVSFEAVGSPGVNAGLTDLHVPDALRRDASRTATLDVFGSGADSADIEVREEGRLVAARRVALPAPGFRKAVELELPPPAGEGRLRYTASVTATGDEFGDDDQAVAYASVGHEEGVVVLVSLRPDWEARYLLPVLEQVTGLGARGFLRVGPDRFGIMGRAVDRGEDLDSAAVRVAAGDAALLVIHGVEGRTDPWARSLVQRAGGRTLFFPVDAGGAGLSGITTAPPRDGEWYAAQDFPASPLAGDLSGVHVQGLPPLTGVLVPSGGTDGDVPMEVQLRGGGPGEAALLLRRTRRGPQAVALASGFWRWAVRAEEGRAAYRSLWSGVAGWLLSADEGGSAHEPRPSKWVYDRGEPAAFMMAGEPGAAMRLSVEGEGGPVLDTTVVAGLTVPMGALVPGRYGYSVVDGRGGPVTAGRFDVEARTEEMLPDRFAVEDLAGTPGVGGGRPSPGRPLRTMLWPYLLVIGLLCVEWVARRRAGLR